jgi:hypothetical protein
MLLVGLVPLALVVVWLARPRPLRPRDDGMRLSERWRLDHLYEHGKHGS